MTSAFERNLLPIPVRTSYVDCPLEWWGTKPIPRGPGESFTSTRTPSRRWPRSRRRKARVVGGSILHDEFEQYILGWIDLVTTSTILEWTFFIYVGFPWCCHALQSLTQRSFSIVICHICPGHTDKSKGANSKKCYLPINFWRLVVKLFQFLKLFPQPFLRYGNPNRIFLGTLKNKFQILKLLMF